MAFDGIAPRGVDPTQICPQGTLQISVQLRKNGPGAADNVRVIVAFSNVTGGAGGPETPLGTSVPSGTHDFSAGGPSDYTYVWTDSTIQATLAAAALPVNRVRISVQRLSAGPSRTFRILGNGSAWVQLVFNQ